MSEWWTIYTKVACPYCVKAKELLQVYGIDYHEIDVTDNPRLRDILKKEGHKTVPLIYREETFIGGHDALVKYFNDITETKVIKRIAKYASLEKD